MYLDYICIYIQMPMYMCVYMHMTITTINVKEATDLKRSSKEECIGVLEGEKGWKNNVINYIIIYFYFKIIFIIE